MSCPVFQDSPSFSVFWTTRLRAGSFLTKVPTSGFVFCWLWVGVVCLVVGNVRGLSEILRGLVRCLLDVFFSARRFARPPYRSFFPFSSQLRSFFLPLISSDPLALAQLKIRPFRLRGQPLSGIPFPRLCCYYKLSTTGVLLSKISAAKSSLVFTTHPS